MILGFMLFIRYVCFVTTLCVVQSVHTELAELYSQKVIARQCGSRIFLGMQVRSTRRGSNPP
jgi:hypothetical protein